MTSVLLAVLLAAAPEVREPLERPPEEPKVNLFCAPVSTVGVAGLAATTGVTALYVPLGATFRLGPRWGLTAELSGSFMTGAQYESPAWSASASFGPTFFVTDAVGMSGLYVTLKALGQQTHAPVTPQPARACITGGCPLPPPTDSRAFIAGVDVGYLWRIRTLTIGLQVGTGLGYEQGQASSFTFPFFAGTGFTEGLAWSLNLNFLRVGYAF